MSWWSPHSNSEYAKYTTGKYSYSIMTSPEDTDLGVKLWSLIGKRPANAKRKTSPGAQDVMIEQALRMGHTYFVAFDVPGSLKAFCSFPSVRAGYAALQRLHTRGRMNTSYEIIGSQAPCRLYMDVEWVESEHGARDVKTTLTLLLTELVAWLREKFLVCGSLTLDDFVITRSRNTTVKQSYHIYLCNKVYFGNNSHDLRAVMMAFYLHLVTEMIVKGRSSLKPLFFDRSVVSAGKAGFRGGGAIVDMMVYTERRQMRQPGSVKLNSPTRVLVPYRLSDGAEIVADPMTMECDAWSRYLVTGVNVSESVRVIPSPEQMALVSGKETPVSVNSYVQRALTAYFTGAAIRDAGKSILLENTPTLKRSAPSNNASESKKVVISHPDGAMTFVAFRGRPLEEYMQLSNDASDVAGGATPPPPQSVRPGLTSLLASLDNSLSGH